MTDLDLHTRRPAPFDTDAGDTTRDVIAPFADATPRASAVASYAAARPSARAQSTSPVSAAASTPAPAPEKWTLKPRADAEVTAPIETACQHALGKDAVITAANCPSRLLLDEIADKWSVLILAALCHGPHRFNELKRRLSGVTQKALTHSLRRLERNGIVSRTVLATSPVAVEYAMTALGQTLKGPFEALYQWTFHHLPAVDAARAEFDARTATDARD